MDLLFQPIALNESLSLNNRLVMAPMTRCFSPNNIPSPEMATYYGKRGDAGLVISEATMVCKDASGYPDTPGIYSEEQIKAWSAISEQVHRRGGKFFLQLWHAGMMSHPIYRNGKPPIAPSNVPPKKAIVPRTQGKLSYGPPKPMTPVDIQEMISAFSLSARNAVRAGCDGIELHAANGYLLDTFLHWYTNKREDAYGGSEENMCRFVLEVVDGVIQEIGADRVGIRLSPVPVPSMDNMDEDLRDAAVFAYLLKEMEKRKIAYVHVSSDDDVRDCGFLMMPVSAFLRTHYKGVLIGCGSYTVDTAAEALSRACFELVAFGRLFLANPNLVSLVLQGRVSELQAFDPATLDELN